MMGELPLISAIMPTTPHRRRFVAQAIRLFNAQDYPNKELIIIDDGEVDRVGDVVPAQENIEYLYIDTLWANVSLTIGAKRNLACSVAKGEFITSWDDDDYYGPHRLSKQVAPLLNGEAELSAMRMSLLLDVAQGTLWTCDDDTHRRLFKQDVHYGTLMYRASCWQHGIHFASVNVGEDRRFVHALLAHDARLARIVDPASFIYMLHGRNTTTDMRIAHPGGWQHVPLEQYLSEEDRAFYATLREEVSA